MLREAHHDERGRRVTVLTLDRPERRNAVDHATLLDLRDRVSAAIADAPRTRVLVLSGADGHFCAGADLSGVEDEGFVALLGEVLRSISGAPFPTIAAVDGAALGAGTQLAAACDLRVATPESTWGVPAGRLGLMVDRWTVGRLIDLVGGATARQILVAADRISGERAFGLGLVQRLGGFDDALEWASGIADLAPLTLGGHKIGIAATEEAAPDADERYDRAFRSAWESDDLQEGLRAFAERRTPRFEGR